MRIFGCYSPSICFAEVPPDDQGGGGTADPPANGGWTEDQMKAMGAMVNQVVTSHLKRQPTLADQLKEVKWSDMLAPLVKELVPTQDSGTPGAPKKPEVSEYEKQLAKLTNDFQTSERARIDADNRAKASETARRTDAGKLKLRSALAGKVNDGAVDHVINHLTLVNNRLVVEEDGSTKLRVKRPAFPGSPPEDMEISVEDAIKDILEESDMQIFLPAPKGKSGSNPGPGGKGYGSSNFVGEAKTDAEKVHRAQVREEEMRRKHGITG